MTAAREGKRGWDRRSEAREGQDKIIPKNDMEELDKGRTGLHTVAKRLVMKISL